MMTENIYCCFSDSSDDELLPSLEEIFSGVTKNKKHSDKNVPELSSKSNEQNCHTPSSSQSSWTSLTSLIKANYNNKSEQSSNSEQVDPKNKRREKIILEKILNGAANRELDKWCVESSSPNFNPFRSKMFEAIDSDSDSDTDIPLLSGEKDSNYCAKVVAKTFNSLTRKSLNGIDFSDIELSADEELAKYSLKRNKGSDNGTVSNSHTKNLRIKWNHLTSKVDEEINYCDTEKKYKATDKLSTNKFGSQKQIRKKPCSNESDENSFGNNYNEFKNKVKRSNNSNDHENHIPNKRMKSKQNIKEKDNDLDHLNGNNDDVQFKFYQSKLSPVKRTSKFECISMSSSDDESSLLSLNDTDDIDSNNNMQLQLYQSKIPQVKRDLNESYSKSESLKMSNNMQLQLYQSKIPQRCESDSSLELMSMSSFDDDKFDNLLSDNHQSGNDEGKSDENERNGRMVVLPAPPKSTRFNAKTSNTMELVPYMPYSNFVPRSTREQQLNDESDDDEGYEVVDDDNDGRVVLVGGGGESRSYAHEDHTEFNKESQGKKTRFRRAPYQFTHTQLEELEAFFLSNPFCPKGRKNELGLKLRLIPDAVLTWFKNARNRIRKRLEKVYRNKNGIISRDPDHIGHVLRVDWDNPRRQSLGVIVSNDYDERRLNKLLYFNWANF